MAQQQGQEIAAAALMSTVLGWWVQEIICFSQPACKKKQQFKNGADEQLQSEHLNFTASEAAS